MTQPYIDLSTTDDAAAVDAAWLLALFEPGASPPAQVDPDMQSLRDVIDATVTAWAQAGDNTRIPAAKLPANQILPPVTGSDVGHVLKVGAGPVLAWAAETPGSGGLNASQVDARILAAIPLARRIPSFAVGDIGEILQVVSDGAGGAEVRFAPDTKDAETLEVQVTQPATAGYSDGDVINVSGALYELVPSGTARNEVTGVAHRRQTPRQASGTFNGTTDLEWSYDGTGTPNIIAHLNRDVLGPNPPSGVVMDFSTQDGFWARDVYLSREVDRDTVRTGDMHGAYAYIEDGDSNLADGTEGFAGALGAHFTAYFYAADARQEKGAPLNVQPANDRWELLDRVHPAPVSQADVYPQAKAILAAGDGITLAPDDAAQTVTVSSAGASVRAYTELADGAGIGISVPDGTTARINGLTLFNPEFDFDASNNGSGVIQIEANLGFGNRADAQLGFDSDTSDPQLSYRQSGFTYASDVKGATAYAAGATNGVKMFDWTVHKGASTVGVMSLYLARDGQNRLGYYLAYAPGAASQSNWDTTLQLAADFLHHDAGAPGGGGLTQAEVDSRVKAGVKDFAEAENAARVERNDLAANQQLPDPEARNQLAWNGAATELENVAPLQSTITPSKAATAFATNGTINMEMAAAALESGQGVSVVNNEIVLANAGLYRIDWAMEFQVTSAPDLTSGGAARVFVTSRWSRDRAGQETVLKFAHKTSYIRDHSDQAGTRVGPNAQIAQGSFDYVAEAGDKIALDILGSFVQPTSGAAISLQVNSGNSQIAVTSMG